MPYGTHKTVTITEKAKKQLGELKRLLKQKSESSTAVKLIDEKHKEVIEDE